MNYNTKLFHRERMAGDVMVLRVDKPENFDFLGGSGEVNNSFMSFFGGNAFSFSAASQGLNKSVAYGTISAL